MNTNSSNHAESWEKNIARKHRQMEWLTNLFPVVSAILAASGSAIFYLLENDDDKSQYSNIVFPIIGIALILLTGLFLYLRKLREEDDARGTAYYLRFLRRDMADYHSNKLQSIASEGAFREINVATRVFPPYDDYRSNKNNGLEVFDLSDKIENMAQAVEHYMATDSSSTGFSFIPNALFPMGLGIGSRLYLFPEKTTMWEVDSRRPTGKDHGDWKLVGIVDDDAGSPVVKTTVTTTGTDLKAVFLTWENSGEFSDDQFPRGEGLIIKRIRNTNGAFEILPNSKNAAKANLYSREYAKSLWETIEEYPDTPIILATRLPKTLQIAIGWRISQRLDTTQATQHSDIWKNLITVAWSPGRNRGLPDHAYRINDSQPSVDVMLEHLEMMHSSVSPTCGQSANEAKDEEPDSR
ncbi:MAG: hypothetical protein GX483_04870 [Actinomycetaceae bacterium]|nr:hypothetical protein [Actinomycetaceae bacterium]